MIKISSILLCILFATALHAQDGYWQQLNGPTGGFSEAMAAGSDGTIYLATHAEDIWKRTPGSSGWIKSGQLPFELDGMTAQPLFAADGKLFLMDGVRGMAVSTDQGLSWTIPDTWLAGISIVNGTLYEYSLARN